MWDKQRVLQLRKSLGLTQAELARELGCRQQTVSEWELGLYVPANAYGQLLSQFELRNRMTQTSIKIDFDPVRSGPLVRESENESFDKPFDPAID